MNNTERPTIEDFEEALIAIHDPRERNGALPQNGADGDRVDGVDGADGAVDGAGGTRAASAPARTTIYAQTSDDEIREALTYIDANPRDTWLAVKIFHLAKQGGWTRKPPAQHVGGNRGERRRARREKGFSDDTPTIVPPGFRLTATELQYLREKKEPDDSDEWLTVCSRLEIRAATRDTAGENWGKILVFRDGDNREHEFALAMELLAGDGVGYRERLLSMGLNIAAGRQTRDRLHTYIISTLPTARARAVARVGHENGAFVFPDRVIGGPAGGERLIFQNALAIDHAFNISGTLEEWQCEVAALCKGNSRLVFGVSASFAAALLEPLGAESGGVNFIGLSSIGKTTILWTSASVWGGSSSPLGYLRQWRATSNGLESTCAMHCDCLLVLDEMAEVDAREAGSMAYMIANGSGKTRARRDGSGRPPMTWRTLLLSSGEISLADKISEDGRGRRATAGQGVRMVDVPGDAGKGHGVFEELHGCANGDEFSKKLVAACKEYYGTACRAFLDKLVANRNSFTTDATTRRNSFVKEYCPTDAGGQVQRVAGRFGLIAAAGELTIAMGVVPWSAGDATAAAGICFKAWLERRGGTGAAELAAGLAQIRKFFELHGESRFTPWDRISDPLPHHPTINRAGVRRDTVLGVEFFVFPETFNTEVCAGFDAGSLARELVKRGILRPDSEGKAVAKVKLPKPIGQKRVYYVIAGALDDLDEEDALEI